MRKSKVTDQATIFNEPNTKTEQPTQQTPDQTVTPDQGAKTPDMNEIFADKLAQITNDQGEQKYSNVFTALEALKATQDHVKTLEGENKQLREEHTKAATMDEILQQMTANKDQTVETKTSGFDAESVKGVTRQTLQEIMAEQAAADNQKSVVEQLKKKFGSQEKAEEQYIAKAAELGLSTDVLDNLAASSPKAVLNYFDVKGEVTPNKNVEGSVNTEAFKAHQEKTEAPKNIMYGADSVDIVNAWKAAGQAVQNELENN